MATDPGSLVPALLSVLQQSGNIDQQSIQDTQQNLGNHQALQLGAMKIAAIKQQQDQDAQYQHDVAGYYQHPTMDQLAMLAAKYPDKAQGLKQAYDVMDANQKQSTQTQYGSIYNAANNNRPDLLKKVVSNIRDAEQKAGTDTSEADDLLTQLDTDPEGAMKSAKAFAQMHLAASGAKGFELNADNFTSTGDGAIYNKQTGEVVREAPQKPQYKTVDVFDESGTKIGQRLIQVGGNPEGGDPASGGSGAYGNDAPRSVRNNNPGNLRASAFTQSLPGYQGKDKDGFAVFDSPQSGAAAQGALLKSYIDRGYNTVAKIINRWAPPSDGNDTSAYVKTVAKQLGVNPSDTLSPAMIPRLQSAISRVEGGPSNPSNGTGAKPSNVVYESTGSGSGNGGLSEKAVNNAAAVYNLTGQLPTRISQKDKEGILNRAAALNSGDAGDLVAGWGSRKAAGKALNDLQSMTSKVEAFESTALRNGALALRLGLSVGNGNVRIFNQWRNAGRRATSDPQVRAFDAALNTFANEFAKVTSSATGGGVTSDSARQEAQSLINSADSPEALTSVMQTLTQDMQNRTKGLDGQKRQLMNALRGGSKAAGSGSAPAGFRIVAVRPAK